MWAQCGGYCKFLLIYIGIVILVLVNLPYVWQCRNSECSVRLCGYLMQYSNVIPWILKSWNLYTLQKVSNWWVQSICIYNWSPAFDHFVFLLLGCMKITNPGTLELNLIPILYEKCMVNYHCICHSNIHVLNYKFGASRVIKYHGRKMWYSFKFSWTLESL